MELTDSAFCVRACVRVFSRNDGVFSLTSINLSFGGTWAGDLENNSAEKKYDKKTLNEGIATSVVPSFRVRACVLISP